MAPYMLLGNQRKLLRVPCPLSPLEMPNTGFLSTNQLANGDLQINRSSLSHKEFQFNWLGTRDEIQPILDMFSGMWGPGPFHFLNPFAANNAVNLAPPHWSAPARAVQKRGRAAIAPFSYRTAFPIYGATLYQNPHVYPDYFTFGGSYPMDAMYIRLFRNAPDILPDKNFGVNTRPFLITPIPKDTYVSVTAIGARTLGGSAIQIAKVLPNGWPSSFTGVNEIVPSALGVAGSTYSYKDASNDHYLVIWLSTRSTTTAGIDTILAWGGLDIRLGTSSTVPTPPGFSGGPSDWTYGRGQGPIDVKTDSINLTGYSAVGSMKKQVALSVEASEVFLPW